MTEIVERRDPEDKRPVIIMSHRAKEASVRNALNIIDRLDVVKDKTMMLRIEGETQE